jgi:hypothetical protein
MIFFRAFMDDDGRDVVSKWHEEHRGKVKAELAARMTYLRHQRREGWTRPYYDSLRDGVGEVRFKVERINYRALGFFGPGRNEFTFCLLATKTNEFDPRNAIELAAKRRSLIESNPLRAVALTLWGQK